MCAKQLKEHVKLGNGRHIIKSAWQALDVKRVNRPRNDRHNTSSTCSKLENLAQSQITLHAPTHQLIFFIVILSLCVQWAKVTPLRLCDGSHSFALALKCKTLGMLRLFIILGRYCVCVNSVCWPCFVGQCLANISLVSGLLRQLLVSDAAFDRAVVVPTLFENPQIK